VGVEVGGAVKNVIAIATGIADGMPAPAGAGARPTKATTRRTAWASTPAPR
jgi:glycerol-3-phosphate dehydrogenase